MVQLVCILFLVVAILLLAVICLVKAGKRKDDEIAEKQKTIVKLNERSAEDAAFQKAKGVVNAEANEVERKVDNAGTLDPASHLSADLGILQDLAGKKP